MDFYNKSDENKRVAVKCINIQAYNAGLSRAYYSVFQKIKGYLIDNNFDYDSFIKSYNRKHNATEKLFSHGTLQQAIIFYMKSRGKKVQDYWALSYIDNLYKKRREADYTEKKFNEQDLTAALQEVEAIFKVL